MGPYFWSSRASVWLIQLNVRNFLRGLLNQHSRTVASCWFRFRGRCRLLLSTQTKHKIQLNEIPEVTKCNPKYQHMQIKPYIVIGRPNKLNRGLNQFHEGDPTSTIKENPILRKSRLWTRCSKWLFCLNFLIHAFFLLETISKEITWACPSSTMCVAFDLPRSSTASPSYAMM